MQAASKVNFIALVCLVLLFSFIILQKANAANSTDEEASKLTLPSSQAVVVIDDKIIQTSGIQVQPTTATHLIPELTTYGLAVNIQPLLEIRSHYFSAKSKFISAKAAFSQAQQSLNRLQNLNRDNAVSTRKLQLQQFQWQSSKASLDASRFQLEAIQNKTLLRWGKEITEWVITANAEQFSKLISGHHTLLLIAMPANHQFTDIGQAIYVQSAGIRQLAETAQYLAEAPSLHPFSQAKQFFFQLNNNHIIPETRLTAWLPLKQKINSGVLIPASAIIWHLGQPYAYIRTGTEQFTRRQIVDPIGTGDGYFVQNSIIPGEELVVTGAQMLLSEEFRNQIPDEDDD
jgi:hypothetical protein